MKTYVLSVLALLLGIPAFSQTTATNFNVNDCDGNTVNLFSKLDAGKVVVIAWVMPCSACAGPAKTAHDVVEAFQSTHPSKVLFYLVDDYANTDCNTLKTWGQDHAGTGIHGFFSNSAISMSNYGTAGMPKVVVTGGSDHKIFFNRNNAAANNFSDLNDAVNMAISASLGVNKVCTTVAGLDIYPNPAREKVNMSYTLQGTSDVQVSVYNMLGEKVYQAAYDRQGAGAHSFTLDLSGYRAGSYIVNINGAVKKLIVL